MQRVEFDEHVTTLHWSDNTTSVFHHLWLRDNCPQLRHATTNHRVVETSEIPADVQPASVVIEPSGAVSITWAHDRHVSTFDGDWLRAYDYSNGARRARSKPTLWDATIGSDVPRATYEQVSNSTESCRTFLNGFRDYGVGLLHEVPTTPGTVLDVAALFGEVRTTSWGRVFDVISMETANSVAYTNLPLVAHTDEAYRDPAPTVQLQHFLRSDTVGGAATLVDGFRVADDLRASQPAMFDLLARTPLYFHFRDDTAEHEYDGPVIELDAHGDPRAIRFSNHSIQPFLMDTADMLAFYDAYRTFGRMRESPEYQLTIEMHAGDLYMVDNRRVMHGRTGFTRGGPRHLQSCYIERDELISRLIVMQRSQ